MPIVGSTTVSGGKLDQTMDLSLDARESTRTETGAIIMERLVSVTTNAAKPIVDQKLSLKSRCEIFVTS